MTRARKITESEVTLDDVQHSEFGCPNCLYSCIECKDYDKFAPRVAFDGKTPSCQSYTYCD